MKRNNITKDSQNIVDTYLTFYTSKPNYGNAVKKISEHFQIKDLRTLNIDHYLEVKKLYQDSITKFRYVDSFFKYLYAYDFLLPENDKRFLQVYGNKEKLKKEFLRQKERTEKKKAGKSKQRVDAQNSAQSILSFQEIERLLEYCKGVGEAIDFSSFMNLRTAFVIYVLFFIGKQREELAQCKLSSYNNGIIKIAGQDIEVPQKYYSMFQYAKEKDKGTKFGQMNSWLAKIGNELGIENLTPLRITMTRDVYSFECPICKMKLLSVSENWSVINGKIICLNCADELLSHGVKKNDNLEMISYDIELLSEKEKRDIKKYASSYKQLQQELNVPCDFDAWTQYLQTIGEIGEKFVYSIEVQKLIDANREDLANMVDASIATDHTNGYDILSYTTTGERLHIEVKSTPGEVDTPFFITKPEMDKAEELKKQGELYKIYRVFNVGKTTIDYKVIDDLSLCKFDEVVYRVTLPEK